MSGSRAAADLLVERAEICGTLFGMAADSAERTAAAKRLREIHADPAVARILEKTTATARPIAGAAWGPTPDEPGEPEIVRWPPDAA
jgi:hypothetical protein